VLCNAKRFCQPTSQCNGYLYFLWLVVSADCCRVVSVAGLNILRIGIRVNDNNVVSNPNLSNSTCSFSGNPDCCNSSLVTLSSVIQQSMSLFAIVNVFAKLPKTWTSALGRSVLTSCWRSRRNSSFSSRSSSGICRLSTILKTYAVISSQVSL